MRHSNDRQQQQRCVKLLRLVLDARTPETEAQAADRRICAMGRRWAFTHAELSGESMEALVSPSDSRTNRHPRDTAVQAIDQASSYSGQQATNYLLEGIACALLSMCDELAAICERLDIIADGVAQR